MSVRRLAEEQPQEFAFTPANEKWALAKIKDYPDGRQHSAILPILMRAQEQEGWVTRPMLEYVAGMLDMPYIRALEIATFYTQFQLQPVGSRGHVQVCGTTPCMLRGAEELIAVCRRKIAREPFHRNPAGTLSWEEVECIGACVNAPVVMIGKDTYEDLTPARFSEIVDAFSAGQGSSIPPGPQIDRQFSAQPSGATTLLDRPKKASQAERRAPLAQKFDKSLHKGRVREINEEAAPAVDGPDNSAKVSPARAEAAKEAAKDAPAKTGEPSEAMRPGVVGSESPGGKRTGKKPEGAGS